MILVMVFKDWFFNQYLEWQRKYGKASVTKFAAWIDISQSSCDQYMSGKKRPAGENLRKIAEKLGYETYDLLGYARPDLILANNETLSKLLGLISDLSDEDRKIVSAMIEEYKTKRSL